MFLQVNNETGNFMDTNAIHNRTSRNMKCFGIKLTNYVHDLYFENSKNINEIKSKMTLVNGEIYHIHKLEDSV